MPKFRRCGYDHLPVYSVKEVADMYMQEGMTESEAIKKAREVVGSINLLTYREKRFWENTRRRESVGGLAPQYEDQEGEEDA